MIDIEDTKPRASIPQVGGSQVKYPITVYLDMDGVLADFDKFAVAKLGKKFDEFPDSETAWAAMYPHQDIYYHLDPMEDANVLVYGVLALQNEFAFNHAILTAIPKIGRIPRAKYDKKIWLRKHFSDVPFVFNIGPHAEHKQYHCNDGDVLIDDAKRNIPQWDARGGYGILHTSAKDSLEKLRKYLENLQK